MSAEPRIKPHHPETETEAEPTDGDSWLRLVQQQITSLSFGEVVITVHDSTVVQIEKTEKVRLTHKA